MARTAEQIETELDEWQAHRTELQDATLGLKESLDSLRRELPDPGTLARKDELTTQLAALQKELAEARAETTALKSELASLPRPSPSPSPPRSGNTGNGGDPEPEPGPEPEPPPTRRTTRTGLTFL